jgi:predicted MFS family arabinose efflux permease
MYENAYSGLTPASWWLSLVMLINRSGTMVVPFMSLYMTQSLGYGLEEAGKTMVFFGLGAICGGFLGGRLSDKIGFYNVQLIALAGGGILFIVLGQMRSLPMIYTFTFLLSLVNDAFRPANSIALAHYSTEENRTRSFSLNRLSVNLGWAAGGSLGGFLAAHNYELLFWVDGITNISAAILLLFVLSPKRNKEAKKHEPIIRDKNFSVWKDKAYIYYIFLTTIFAFCFFQLFTTMPVFYKTQLKMHEISIGIVMALNGILIALFEMIIVHKLEGKRSELAYISLGTLVVALSFLVFNIFPGAEMLAVGSMLICTLGEILSMPFMNTFWINRSNGNNRGQYAALFTIAWAIAQVTGPYVGTTIAHEHGFQTLWWMVAALLVAGAIGYWSLQQMIKPQE